ncbi:MAG: hypothetical protein HOM11_03945 [Methylococcales bacterium]|nr:hypothetical protein [Methylococcales bacterium]
MGQQQTSHLISEQTTQTWGDGEQQLTASIHQQVDDDNIELHHYDILVLDQHDYEMLKQSVDVDWDMGGAGLVTFIQLDNDADMEIIVTTKGGVVATNYYLDYHEGQIKQTSLNISGDAINSVVKNWYTYHAPNPYSVGLLALLTVLFYLLFFPMAWLLRKLFFRHHGT